MEDGIVNIVRAAAHVEYPASFTLLAAVNPCPCGYLGHPKKECKCTDKMIRKYENRISGPILDRIDIHLTVPEVKVEKLSDLQKRAETSQLVRQRVQKARDRQTRRFKGSRLTCNAEMNTKEVKKYCPLDADSLRLMQLATEKMNFSARAYYRIVKVARTIADLSGVEEINSVHVGEAIQYRQPEEGH